MDKLFDIIFLEEAFAFLRELDKKHYEKILYNIRKAQNEQDPELFKNLLTKFGNLEHFIRGYNIGFLLFGIRQTQKILW